MRYVRWRERDSRGVLCRPRSICALTILGVCACGAPSAQDAPRSRRDAQETRSLEHLGIRASAWFNVERPIGDEELRGHPVLVEYWATWCLPCRQQVQPLNELHERYASAGLVLVALTDEAPARVADYVERLQMRYPVGAGADFTALRAVRALPHAALYSQDGRLLAEGAPAKVYPRLHVLMRRTPAGAAPMATKPGAVIGDFPRRPSFAKGFEEPALEAKVSALLTNLSVATPEELGAVYDFYWKNLPAGDWPGDGEARRAANFALPQLYKQAQSEGSSAVPRSVRGELLRRLSKRDPSWAVRSRHARYVGFLFERGDPEAIDAIRSALSSERNPIVRYRLSQSLASVDSSVSTRPAALGPLADAERRYREASARFSSRLWGLPREFAPYSKYVEEVNKLLEPDEISAAAINRLRGDFQRHDGTSPSDLLIRARIAEAFSDVPSTNELSPEARKALEMSVFELLGIRDLDSDIRLKLLYALETVGWDTIGDEAVVDQLERLLATETHPLLRATLEYNRLRITHPEAIK